MIQVTEDWNQRIDYFFDQLEFKFREESYRLAKSGGASEQDLESTAFFQAVLLLVAESYVPAKSEAKKIYNNLRHF